MPGAPSTPGMPFWGAWVESARAEEGFIGIALLQDVADSLDDLVKHRTLDDLFDVSGNDEANFTTYERYIFDHEQLPELEFLVDSIPPRVTWSPDNLSPMYASPGGAVDNEIVSGVLFYAVDPDNDPDTEHYTIQVEIFDTPFETDGSTPLNSTFPQPTVWVQKPEEPDVAI